MMKSISLFSGAMGLDLGLEQAGFETTACIEIDDDAVATIRKNRVGLPVFHKSVVEVTGEEILRAAGLAEGELTIVSGGPPCQPFSVFGNRKGIRDSRGLLVYEYIRLVEELKPKAFVMENVRGLLSMPLIAAKDFVKGETDSEHIKSGSLLQHIFEGFAAIGYRVDCFVVNAVNYGAPQLRERLILIGNRHNQLADFPKPRYSNRAEDQLPPFITLGEVIGPGFDDPCPEVMNFSPRKLRYLEMVPPGGNWRSLPVEIQKESMGKSWYLKGGRSAYWRKLSFDFPSPTVVTMPNHAGTSMCHPTELRAITVGEAAAIQEFPRDWEFCGNTASKFKQIGNAVPVRLGKVAGETVKELLQKVSETGDSLENHPQHTIIHVRPHVRTRTFYKNGQVFAGSKSYYEREEQDNEQPSLFEREEALAS